jgi:hypothetical protein
MIPDLAVVESESGAKTANSEVQSENIKYEVFHHKNSPSYNFITFELRDSLR